MGKSGVFLRLMLAGAVLTLATLFDDAPWVGGDPESLGRRVELVRSLGLTDLALFTEARYTRHLSQADLHSAFQDHPGALEHFPSGSLTAPPRHLRNEEPDR